jgi:uncharacterized protein
VILYLHGFTSGPQSQKARLLGARAAERGIEFICPQLPHSPAAAIELAEGIIARKVGRPLAAEGAPHGGGVATASGMRDAELRSAATASASTVASPQARPLLHAPASPGDTVALVGSSLGGYYATWLAEKYGLRAVLVNPAVVAHISLEKFIGPQQNLYTGERFDFTLEHLAELHTLEVARLSHPENLWLLVEAGDEVLDYRQAVTRYAGARQTVLASGDHSFTRWAGVLDQVIDFANEHPV